MAEQPNIVIIMTDQQRADLCRREGFALDTTPFLDHLATEGTSFNHAYTSMPVCAPARISMFTGRYASATRVRTNHNIADVFYSDDLVDVLKQHGYVTALCGKNHSHLSSDRMDYWFECSHLGIREAGLSQEEEAFNQFLEQTHFHASMTATPFPVECQLPYRIVSRAQSWIESIREEPFFLWLSFPEPHNPYQVPEPYFSVFDPDSLPPPLSDESALETKGFAYQWCRSSFEKAFPGFPDQIARCRANYLGMLRLLDDQVRRFTGFLDEHGMLENTLVIFLSDHGDFVGQHGLMRKGPELPEPLVRIPLMFRGPGIDRRSEPDPAFVSIVDILPTLCEMIGADMPSGAQGRSLWPLLTGTRVPATEFQSCYAEHGFGGLPYSGDEPLDPAQDGLHVSVDGQMGDYDCLNSWTQSGTARMVRKGDWKLAFGAMGRGQLYDLAKDPAELRNLYGDHAYSAVQLDLTTELLKWLLRVQDPLPLPRQRYVMKTHPRNYWT